MNRLSCSRAPCQSEVPDMQQLSREIIIEHDYYYISIQKNFVLYLF